MMLFFTTAAPWPLAVGIADFEDHVFVCGSYAQTVLRNVDNPSMPPKTYKILFTTAAVASWSGEGRDTPLLHVFEAGL
jgi:hypothetical protein